MIIITNKTGYDFKGDLSGLVDGIVDSVRRDVGLAGDIVSIDLVDFCHSYGNGSYDFIVTTTDGKAFVLVTDTHDVDYNNVVYIDANRIA